MSDTVREGGCACGQARYRVTAAALFVNQCHCSLCRRQSGSAFALNMFIETAHVALLSGELSENSLPTGSGGQQAILRCRACGTALWSHYGGLGRGVTAIRVGTLDDPGDVVPDAAIHVADRLPWLPLPEGVPAFDAYYRPSELLPPERFARLKAVLRGNEGA